MTSKESNTGVVDPPREIVESESELKEEVHRLKHQMAEMYQAWIMGHPPPSFFANYTKNPAFIPPLAQAQNPTTVDLSPQHAPDPYSYTPHFEPPVETEKPSRNVEQDEIFRKVKSLEQSLKNMQGIGSQVSVVYKDLCLFPDVQLPAGFKMPKFDMYDGHGDPVAHLRGFCSKMRGAGGKDELLMAYFSQSLSGEALEWYTRQDASRWYIWDDLAQAFARHFQYNIDIIPDRLSLTKVEKKPSERFREYGFRWREQVARVNPLMEEDEMSYAQPPPYPQWHAPTPQNPYPPPQPYRNPTGPSFRSRPDYRKERQQRKETFTPLRESYTSLFQRLRQLDVLRPIEPKIPNPPPRNLDYSLRCAYYSDAPGHDTEKCWHLKRAIQELIDTYQIVVQSPEAPNINQNPFPAHVETHMIEIVHKDGEPKNSSKSVTMIRASESNPVKAPDFAKAMPLTIEGVSERLSTLNVKPSVLVVKGPPIDVEANQKKQKVIVAYKGKEVEEEVNETGGLTRSGRCFTLEELRKAKPFKDGLIPVKKPVTEEEAEEFLKKIKM
ncbi:uncharacterized protein [Nicotiana tomentosiformis]|uniref:uncharacterized protein n=1 Tax=Nicotiana tomentosiformis TaxID=4098 RepID=UPI00388CEC29